MENKPIDASTYRRLIDGLLVSLDAVIEENHEAMKLFQEYGNTDMPAYAACLSKDRICKAIKNRILIDLETAQEEANSFEGFDA